ncbi:stalk domain-containing protein [Brevibacillus migulae]|uniref:stalk domain-containing protein n=1 Tax=Brevibacillus migulae TaxID=1644114 RepID=UPI00106DF96C|nr:stalk domain-containing protein [Brevibacillus migulae]
MKARLWKMAVISCLATVFLAGGSHTAVHAAASNKPSIMLDGYPLSFPTDPVITNGYTMVPFRAIAEAMNIEIEWNGVEQSITARKGSGDNAKVVRLQLNQATAYVNGNAVTLPIAPRETNGHTLIPLSFFSQQFGAQVGWDGNTRTVSITTPPEEMYKLGFYAISSFAEKSLIPSFDSVAFGWSRIDGEGHLTVEGKDFYWPQPAGDITPEKILDEAKSAGTAPYLMVFAADEKGDLGKLLSSPDLREQAISEIAALAQEKGFSGIALDFEGLGHSGEIEREKQLYTEFVSLLSERVRPLGLQLTVVLHPLNGAYQGYDYMALGAVADDVVVMAYAYEQEKAPEPLGRVNEAIQLALQQLPKEKLILGISMGSEDAQSVNAKIGLAKRYDLKGIAIWRLGLIGQPAFDQMKTTVTMQ